MAKLYNASSTAISFSGITAGSAVAGPSVFVGSDYAKVASLVALLSLTPNTSGITFSPLWQGSNDNSTWVNIYSQNGAQPVAISTGTLTATSYAVEAPSQFQGWRYMRITIVVGVHTGGASDVGNVGYNYRQLTGAEGGYA
jgi:hypothetical protein